MSRCKRPSIREAVELIALNDSAGDDDAREVKAMAALTTVVIVADLFGIGSEDLAQRIVDYRIRNNV